ncbi:MAG: energy-coupling factor transporter transmembrane component T [Coriobacteriales bacterium]|nr:energy-coupling factor transporter transmembrane component T [Coriobacteriales bacterium]
MTEKQAHVRLALAEMVHPAVSALCLGGCALVGMCVLHPVYEAISLLGALAFCLATRGVRETGRKLLWMLPLLALICLANPLFSASGSTLLMKLGPLSIYLESLVFGAVMGAMLVASLLWLEGMALAIPQDHVLSLAGGALPTVSLMISIATGLVPQLMRQATDVRTTRAACTCAGPRQSRLRELARGSTMVVSWALEDSLERSDAMRARGWSAHARRSSYRLYEMRDRDLATLFVVALVLVASAILGMVAGQQWHFYPTMPQLILWWGYAPYAILAFTPAVATLVERLRWETTAKRPAREEGGSVQ